MKDLEKNLAESPLEEGKLVVVDGLFSMGGDIALLPDIVRLCKHYGARLMVDDAHAIGILGGGRGTAAHFNLTSEVDLIMGTFSKSLASLGGFIAGDEEVIHYIKHHARSLIFSASIPPANTAAALAALHVIQQEPQRVQRVNGFGEYMRTSFQKMGFNIGDSESPIVPIMVGDDMRAFITWKMLFENGVYVNVIISPAVPHGRQLLRTSYMATHTMDQLNKVLEAFEQVGKTVSLADWNR